MLMRGMIENDFRIAMYGLEGRKAVYPGYCSNCRKATIELPKTTPQVTGRSPLKLLGNSIEVTRQLPCSGTPMWGVVRPEIKSS